MVDFPRADGTTRYEVEDRSLTTGIQDEAPNQVNVKEGVEEFNQLEQKFSPRSSQTEKQLFTKNPELDVEKGEPEKKEEFDLHRYFEESVRQDEKRGRKTKKMGVVVKDLTVVGQGYDATSISDNLTPIRTVVRYLWPPNWLRRQSGTPFDILHNVDCFCKEGEMLLVLGRPGSGCSSLLRVIANQRKTYVDVKGEVSYGGLDAKEFSRYTGEAVYVPEEDLHYATLTVEQTLDFALKMKTPGQLLPEEHRKTFRQTVLDALLNMYGLVKQRKTIAGNEFVRGLSGGERKRLTISEATVATGAIDCWDCSTRGLDSASALDYARCLRITTDSLNKTSIATFYQASESIYNLFDRVMVLEKGRCIFFGTTKEARPYFQNLGFVSEPRKSTPDFVTGITNAQERKIAPGFEDKVPKTSAELEEAYRNSDQYKRVLAEMEEYKQYLEKEKPGEDFKKTFIENKSKGSRKKSKYSTNWFYQILALTRRQQQIFLGNKFNIITRYMSVIIQALVYGSAFYNLPLNATGGYTRGGALFSAILFNCFISISEMAAAFMGRPILEKHKTYAFYHPSAFYLSNVVMDIPINLVQIILWSVITYFMYGLDATAGKFFVYLFTIFISALCITQLFRLLAVGSRSMYLSQQILSALLILLLTYTGFSLPKYKMHGWLVWVYYINPISYAFRGLFSNEMRGLVFDCSDSGHVPIGPSYTNSQFRTCLITGALPGETTVTGERFLKQQYDFDTDQMTIDILIVFFFFIGFTLLNCIIIEVKNYSEGGYSRKTFKRGKAPKQNDAVQEAELQKNTEEATNNLEDKLTMSGGIFMWKDIKYTVPVKEGKRLLLDNVEGWIKPGQMTALMGSSGAGKTTLLDVLAQRKTLGEIEGQMLLNGRPLRKDFERITGYVEQMDVFNPYVTVREALQFSAKLRQEPSVPLEEKYAYVEQVLEMMEMKQLGDAIIGSVSSGEGISVEERKRLTIGMELVAKPHIMFLDEPTSGLDSQSSYNIIKFIRKLADAGMPLVCTIHQPSPVLFEFFDRLLLLARGGKTVYFGDIGDKSKLLLDYFESHGARHCTENENPAEYILEAIGAGVHGASSATDWPALWSDGPERKEVHKELLAIEEKAKAEKAPEDEPREFATGVGYQTIELYKRLNVVWWRSPAYNFGRLVNAVVVGLIIGFSYWNAGYSTSDLQTRILAIFQILILGIMLIVAALPQFSYLRDLFRRDYSSKFYGALPFALALIAVDLPYVVLAGTLCVVCAYWSANLDSTAEHGFYFWIMFILFFLFCTSFGQLIGALAPNVGIAIIILPIFNTFLFLFAGVLVPPNAIPKFWRYWMYWVDPDHYFLEGVITNVFKDLELHCDQRDFIQFPTPPGQTCLQYAAAFLAESTGYIANPDATSPELCNYCTYSRASEFYDNDLYNWSYDHRWRNFGILGAFWIFNIFVSSVCIYVFRKQKRCSYSLETIVLKIIGAIFTRPT